MGYKMNNIIVINTLSLNMIDDISYINKNGTCMIK